MKPTPVNDLLPDDPRITAYALGELDADDREMVEAAMRRDPTLRRTMVEIRATVAQIEGAFAHEAATTDDAGRDNVVEFPGVPRGPAPVDPYGRSAQPKLLRYPQIYYVVGGLAAACFAVIAVWRTPPTTVPRPTASAVSPGGGGTGETVLIDMSALVGAAEIRSEVVDTTAQPRGLLEQTKAEGKIAAASSAGMLTLSAANRSAMSGRDGVIFNESRGLAGSSWRDVTPITDFDTVAPREPVPADAPVGMGGAVVAMAPTSASAAGTLFLSPFTMSAERLRARAAAAAAAQALADKKKAETNAILAKAEVFIPPPLPAALRPPRIDRATARAETYGSFGDNEFVSTAKFPRSTFSAEADAGSFGHVRRFVQNGRRPPRESVRIEELLNYFPYRYAPPAAKGDAPLAASFEVTEAPWAPTHRLVRIGLQAREVAAPARAAANLVFLVDVSGSMNGPGRLPLVKDALRSLLAKLQPADRVAIVTYAEQAGLVLPSTPVARAQEIMEALAGLTASGSTSGTLGIHLAYDIAKANRVDGGINRVILCTDGDFQAGPTTENDVAKLVAEQTKAGVLLAVFGFGTGDLKGGILEKIAARGNGTYGTIDSRREAENVLGVQVDGPRATIAKDVQIHVEFNPAQVASYRLLGYENRGWQQAEAKIGQAGGGQIAAGHTVTALYEIIPAREGAKAARKNPDIEDRRYNFYAGVTDSTSLLNRSEAGGRDLLTVNVHYKKPDGLLSRRLDFPLTDAGAKFENASPDFKFAAAVAGFGMVLRESPHKGTTTLAQVVDWAEAGLAEDAGGYRAEFVELARQLDALEK